MLYEVVQEREHGSLVFDSPKTQETSIDAMLSGTTNIRAAYSSTETGYVAIVARENSSYASGYVVADHIRNADALIIVDSNGNKRADTGIVSGLSESMPGADLVERIKEQYGNIEIIVTGRSLQYPLMGSISNDVVAPGTDIDDVILEYCGKNKEDEESETTKERDKETEEVGDEEVSDRESREDKTEVGGTTGDREDAAEDNGKVNEDVSDAYEAECSVVAESDGEGSE